jgi:gas vesicle protein
MALEDLLAAGLLGAIAGVISAWLTARGQVKTVREEYDGRIRELERKREHELADRQAAETQAEAAEVAELRRATSGLVGALKEPDVMRHNVTAAQRDLEAAVAVISHHDVRPVARGILEAAGAQDIDRLQALLQQL